MSRSIRRSNDRVNLMELIHKARYHPYRKGKFEKSYCAYCDEKNSYDQPLLHNFPWSCHAVSQKNLFARKTKQNCKKHLQASKRSQRKRNSFSSKVSKKNISNVMKKYKRGKRFRTIVLHKNPNFYVNYIKESNLMIPNNLHTKNFNASVAKTVNSVPISSKSRQNITNVNNVTKAYKDNNNNNTYKLIEQYSRGLNTKKFSGNIIKNRLSKRSTEQFQGHIKNEHVESAMSSDVSVQTPDSCISLLGEINKSDSEIETLRDNDTTFIALLDGVEYIIRNIK